MVDKKPGAALAVVKLKVVCELARYSSYPQTTVSSSISRWASLSFAAN
jgi:hypothetical protein